jgi:hypothetical protein
LVVGTTELGEAELDVELDVTRALEPLGADETREVSTDVTAPPPPEQLASTPTLTSTAIKRSARRRLIG